MADSRNANSSQTTEISPNDFVTLQVRHKTFSIRASTLAEEAHFFKNIFFDAAAQSTHTLDQTADGAYVIEADPSIFEHIVNYCLFLTFPLFYERGFLNLEKYAQLLQLSRYYQVWELARWIEGRGFERAITTTMHLKSCATDGMMLDGVEAEVDSGIVAKHYFTYRTQKRVWRCPRGKAIHQRPGSGSADANACGKECAKMGDGNWKDLEEDWLAIVTKKEVINFSALAPAAEEGGISISGA